MYIHEFCGSWYDHPFWHTAFLLDKDDDLRAIQSTCIKDVWIDTDKGLNVEGGKAEKAVAAKVDNTLAQANTNNNTSKKIASEIGVHQEAARAAKILVQSKQAVASMFHEARMGKALNASDAMPLVEEIASSLMRNSGAVISLARLKNKDNYTYMHSVAVSALMMALARQLELTDKQVHQAGMAGLMHDIGKTKTPLDIINKPTNLTDAEFSVIKNHTVEGHQILLESHGMSDIVLHVCLQHHEKLDGSGYPARLANEDIDMFAKMGAVCDVYDAITSVRAYKKGWEPAESIRKMAEWGNHYFDRQIFYAFVKSVGIYPIGSLVRLASDHLGVVIEQTDSSLLTPILMVFFSIKANCRMMPEILDLSKPRCTDKIVSHEDPDKWGINDVQALWSGVAASIC